MVQNYGSVIFDDQNKVFTIRNGTQGMYAYHDVARFSILNEKANYKGKGIPFCAILPSGPLPSGILSNPYLYVGIKIVLKDGTVLAIYVSNEKTMVNTDAYIQDRKNAEIIKRKLNEVVKGLQLS